MNELYKVDTFPSFEELVEKDINRLNQESDTHEPSFVRRSIYYPQLKRFYDRFPEESIKVIGFKDLIGKGKIDTLNGVLRFLDLKDSDWGFLKDEKRNSRVYTDVLEEKTAKELAKFFEPYNQQLFDFLGYKPNW